MSRSFGYARVSTADQDLAIQTEALKAAGCEFIRAEKVSGKSREGRTELAILLDFIGSGDMLVVTKLDRLARSLSDLCEIAKTLEGKGAQLRVLNNAALDTSTPTGRMLFGVLGAIGQFERDLIRERQSEGIANAKRERRYLGGTVRHNPEAIRAKRAAGMGPAQIARELSCSEATVFRVLRLA